MAEKIATLTSRTEQRAVIKHCVHSGMTPTDTYKFMKQDKSKAACSRALVFRWHKRISDGNEDINDSQRTGRPSVVSANEIQSVRELCQNDRLRTIREIIATTQLKRTSVHKIMNEQLNLSKVSARWVPRLLSTEEKIKRVMTSREFIRRFERQGQRVLDRIVTTDKTYISLYDPESKFDSMVWKHPSSPPPVKAKSCRSTKRFMFIFFMDSQGMLLQHAVPQGMTVNADYYQKVIRRDLLNAIRKKRPGTEVDNLLFHQDNAPPHRCNETLMTIDFLGFQSIDHAPYSPDLAPFDFAMFSRLKRDLRGKRYNDLQDLRMAVRSTVKHMKQVGIDRSFDSGLSGIISVCVQTASILKKM